MNAKNISDLSKEELVELTKVYAKNWLAHDGSWFLAIEEKYGIDSAIEMDRESWRRFTVVEAKRLIEFLKLAPYSGVEGLKKALSFRLYSSLNEDEIEIINDNTLIYRVKSCRVQRARKRKELNYFPCKSVGVVEYELFAKAIDERFETECVSCHPEISNPDYNCIWKFVLKS